MRFPREGLLCPLGKSFDDSLRPSLPTIAEPTWFAPPIDVRLDDREVTLLFHVHHVHGHASHPSDDLRVDANGSSIFVWGPRFCRRGREGEEHRALRVFALPFEVDPQELQTSRTGDVLRVRIAKKADRAGPDAATPFAGLTSVP